MSDGVRVAVFAGRAEPGVARAVRRAVERGATAVTEAYEADLAIALDPDGLSAARDARVPLCCALAPDVAVAQAEALGSADLVLVAHEAVARQLERHGTPRARIATVGPVPPQGFAPAGDRDGAAREAGLSAARVAVVVPAAMIEEHGLHALLVQLGLTARPVTWLFDVGRDARLAGSLRREVPVHGLDALMFAGDGSRGRSAEPWALAHAALARADGPEVSCALGVAAALVLVGGESVEAGALEGDGLATRAGALPALAVTLDGALEPEALHRARAAARGLDAAASAERAVSKAVAAWRACAEAQAHGLPVGLERLGEATAATDDARAEDEDVDARIERELADLKKRLK